MLFYILYFLLLLLITALNRRGWKTQIFSSAKKYGWLLTGLSLFMFYLSADQGQLAFEVIRKNSVWNMWQFWSSMIGAFIVPLIFAPLWHRLQLSSDNEFIDLRFGGKGAAALKIFRAYYVGLLIVSLLLSFHLLAFSKFISVFYGFDKFSSLAIIGAVLLLYSVKNIFSIKLKTDLLHALFYVIALGLLLYFAMLKSGGFFNALAQVKAENPSVLNNWPLNNEQLFFSFSFIFIQWWSVQVMDGGGPEMIRFKAAKNEKSAILTRLSSILFGMMSSLFLLILIVMLLSTAADDYNSSIYAIVPNYLHPLIILGWFGLFISTCESLLLWGAGFWTEDLYHRLSMKKEHVVPPYFKLLAMLFLAIFSISAAYNADSLQDILKWFFALSAGVAPIIFLRWFWMRINAWTQLAAMLSSPILNLLYGTTYYATQTLSGCESIQRFAVFVVISTPPSNQVTLNGNTLTAVQAGASYQWLDCNNNLSPIPGQTSQSFIPQTSGSYAVSITSGACSVTSACTNLTIVGVNTPQQLSYNIYPNPTSSLINIEKTGSLSISEISIYDVLGRKISSIMPGNNSLIQMETPQIPGTYYISIEDENGKRALFKVLKI